jgi:hypothetical protein
MLTKHMRGGNVVRNAINPSAERASGIEPRKAPPQLKMNLLNEITALLRIGFISMREPLD